MDGRGALTWSAVLLLAAAGCQHQVVTLTTPGPLSAADKIGPIDPSKIKPASDKPKELPPQVWVSSGDFKASEAADPDLTPDRQQYIRELARSDYEQALKRDAKYLPAYQGLARLFQSMHDTPLAIETYRKALQIAPNNAPLWYEMGMCYHSAKNWQPALDCLSRARQIDPRNHMFANAQAVVLAETGRYQESLSCFIHSNGEALGHYRLAQTLQRLQQPELSQRYLEIAMQMDPSLGTTLAVHRGDNGSANPVAVPVQQTAYQDAYQVPNVSPAPVAPAAAPPAMPPSVSSSENPPAQQQVIPPPPPVNEQYEQP
jgi:hypothetical protein